MCGVWVGGSWAGSSWLGPADTSPFLPHPATLGSTRSRRTMPARGRRCWTLRAGCRGVPPCPAPSTCLTPSTCRRLVAAGGGGLMPAAPGGVGMQCVGSSDCQRVLTVLPGVFPCLVHCACITAAENPPRLCLRSSTTWRPRRWCSTRTAAPRSEGRRLAAFESSLFSQIVAALQCKLAACLPSLPSATVL